MELLDEGSLLQTQITGVAPQEALQIDSCREVLPSLFLEGAEEPDVDPSILGHLLGRQAPLQAPAPQGLADGGRRGGSGFRHGLGFPSSGRNSSTPAGVLN